MGGMGVEDYFSRWDKGLEMYCMDIGGRDCG